MRFIVGLSRWPRSPFSASAAGRCSSATGITCRASWRRCAIRSVPTSRSTWQAGPQAPASGARPPNVIVILADDLGWNDLTFNGGGVADGAVPTPRINSIGTDGVTFTQAYAGNATCAPSRAAIMTGRYATRFGFEFTPAPKAFSKLISTFNSGASIPEPLLQRTRKGRAGFDQRSDRADVGDHDRPDDEEPGTITR